MSSGGAGILSEGILLRIAISRHGLLRLAAWKHDRICPETHHGVHDLEVSG